MVQRTKSKWQAWLLMFAVAPIAVSYAQTNAQVSAGAESQSAVSTESKGPTGTRTAGQGSAQASAQSQSQGAASPAAVASGTKINAVLESAVNARTAKPGDTVAARVTKDVKQGGRVVIRKGDRLLGKVVSAESPARQNSESRLTLAFDQLQSGEATFAFPTVIHSVLASQTDVAGETETMQPPMPARMPAANPASGGGGVLSGVGATANSAVGVAGGVAGQAAGHLGGTVSGAVAPATGAPLGAGGLIQTPARAIRVESQGAASQNGGLSSILTTRQGDLFLAAGTALE